MVEVLFYCGVLVSVGGIVVSCRHLLRLLLLLEVFVFSLFLGSVVVGGVGGGFNLGLMVLGLGACEAAVGLGILIRFARVKGGELVRLGLMIRF